MNFDNSIFNQKMDELRSRYTQQLNVPIAHIKTLLAEMKNGTFNFEHSAQLKSIAHNHKGTGTTYGFKDITKTAAALENQLLKGPSVKITTLIKYTENFLDSLIQVHTD